MAIVVVILVLVVIAGYLVWLRNQYQGEVSPQLQTTPSVEASPLPLPTASASPSAFPSASPKSSVKESTGSGSR